jgi:hypothetical protein
MKKDAYSCDSRFYLNNSKSVKFGSDSAKSSILLKSFRAAPFQGVCSQDLRMHQDIYG